MDQINNSTDSLSERDFYATRFSSLETALIITAQLCVMAVGIFGNVLTVIAVVKVDSLRIIGNSFIVSLAVADLLVNAVSMPLAMLQDIFKHWWMGEALCIIFVCGNYAWNTASIWNIVCVSMDRYVAITDPLRYNRRITQKMAVFMICMVWTISFTFAYIPLLTSYMEGAPYIYLLDENGLICFVDLLTAGFSIMIFSSLGIPCILMIIFYGIIFHVARKQAKQVAQMDVNNQVNTGTSIKKGHKAAKTLGLIVGVFLAGFMPVYIAFIIALVNPAFPFPPYLQQVLTWLSYCRSSVNPIIYPLFNHSFRKVFKKLLCQRN